MDTLHELLDKFETSPNGLTSMEAEKRLQLYGENRIDSSKKRNKLLDFIDQFKSPLILILLFAVLISFLAGEPKEGIVILTVVIVNALVGFVQQYRSEKTVEALKKMISYKARVLRDGKEEEIDAKLLVPGDIVFLFEGNTVPADGILLDANVLKIDESVLTGESLPVEKLGINEIIGEKSEKGALSMGTICLMGYGKAVVTATGFKTKFGEIAQLVSEAKEEKTPIQEELEDIGLFVGKAVLVLSAVLFFLNYFLFDKGLVENLLFAISIAVAAVPEGLPATITIALALGVKTMAKHKAVIKKLSSVETLGSISVICSDKTGTLTKNELTLKEVELSSGEGYHFHGVGYDPTNPHISAGHIGDDLIPQPRDQYHTGLKKMMEIFHYCNDSHLKKTDTGYKILGDPTEGSLKVAVEKTKAYFGEFVIQGARLFEIPFNSDRKRMSVIVQTGEEKNKLVVYSKGAPSVLLNHCSHYFDGKVVKELTIDKIKEFSELDEKLALEGMRVMAFAYKEIDSFTKPKTEKEIDAFEKKLIYVGLAGLIDPPRLEIKESVGICRKAGVKVYVITGDHPLTAKAVAGQLDIFTPGKPVELITGVDLETMEDSQISNLLNWESNVVFARVNPAHKMRIVSLLKKMGERVAVTGDGVNDAPALKTADIGISMGITGTDVAKEAADVILTDDSFASIVAAIRQGRRMYENMKKFVWFVFSTNIGELSLIFLALIIGLPAPLTAVLILLINLGTDMFPAVALGIEPEEPGIINKPPRKLDEKIMNRDFILHFSAVGIFIGIIVLAVFIQDITAIGWDNAIALSKDSFEYKHATTLAFTMLVFMELANSFNAKSFEHSVINKRFFNNHYLLVAILFSTLLMLLVLYTEQGNYWFATVPLEMKDWITIFIFSVLTILFEETRKFLFIKRKQQSTE